MDTIHLLQVQFHVCQHLQGTTSLAYHPPIMTLVAPLMATIPWSTMMTRRMKLRKMTKENDKLT
jgi:hypothetical protein